MAPAATTSRKRSTAITPKKPTSRAAPASSSNKLARPNASILNFFQKAEKEEEALFVAQRAGGTPSSGARPAEVTERKTEPDPQIYDPIDLADEPRFNESSNSSKRRRLSVEGDEGVKDDEDPMEDLFGNDEPDREAFSSRHELEDVEEKKNAPTKRKGPFMEDSDSDEDSDDGDAAVSTKFPFTSAFNKASAPPSSPPRPPMKTEGNEDVEFPEKETSCPPPPTPPSLPMLTKNESVDSAFADVGDFADLENFPDEEDLGGEEYRMMRFMEEQAMLENEAGMGGEEAADLAANAPTSKEAMVVNCPICDGSLAGISSDEATRHVNACLDGNPIPLPQPKEEPQTANESANAPKLEEPATLMTVEGQELGKRFARAAVPREGQANPFNVNGGDEAKPNSAFSQLMSGHAESAAWANAAASDKASRGKPAYERTCPFYKIMPGFNICVDAFRYGAVKGCKAYFLSHFHSDHYIGLTAHWTHGPIYCSKVTGDLVKMQLKTDAKFVKQLEFEETVEIPGIAGVTVTMLPANHCPGSSLFLFEKTMGKPGDMGKSGNTRKERILHCGDFRACPGHVGHPLLKPNLQDSITGKVKQQTIDICYLDTTYLNPRYSFPPQEDVIRSCAELCAAISPDPDATDDIWGRMHNKGNGSVSKYFTSAKQQEEGSKREAGVDSDGNGNPPPPPAPGTAASLFANVRDKKPPACRQRLLVICGTYSIGKERICKAIAKALGTKIFASAAKIRICSTLGDPELAAMMTSDPLEAQVHMQMLMEIRAETLRDYLDSYRPHFSRIVGFRPSGWNYRPSAGTSNGSGAGGKGAGGVGGGPAVTANANTSPGSVPTTSVLHSKAWRSRFCTADLIPQRGSTKEAMCFGVPYSEHSSFRELALFVMALRIEKVVPTVNVGSDVSRKRMKGWLDRWMSERRRGGLVKALVEGEDDEDAEVWDGKDGRGGGAWW